MKATRGRPRTFDENDVIDRAVDVFWRSGYRSTTTRDLEATLGMSASSLYNAFGSKQGLFAAAMDHYESRVGESLLAPLEAGNSDFAALHRFIDTLVHTVTADGRGGCLMINLMADEGRLDGRLAARTAAYRARIRAALATSLRSAGGDEASRQESEDRAEVLYGITLGINILARSGSTRREVDRLVASAHALLDNWST